MWQALLDHLPATQETRACQDRDVGETNPFVRRYAEKADRSKGT